MSHRSLLLLLLLLSMFSSSCGLVQKIAVGTTADLLYDATEEVTTESNYVVFREGVPGNLKMMEGLLYLEPKNEKLLVGLTKGYAGFAFTVDETSYLKDFFLDKEESLSKKQALINYTKALNYGLRFLNENDITYEAMMKLSTVDKGIFKLLDDNLSDDFMELEGALFTAQSLGSLIFLQRDSMIMVSQLSIVKGIFDWVCSKDPDIHFGACDIFYGAYEAGRPKTLGGDPAKGNKIFKSLIEKQPHNWFARVAYIRFYLIPMGDEDGYYAQKDFLEAASERFDEFVNWRPNSKIPEEFTTNKVRLYQSLALKQFEVIKKYESEIF